MAFVLQKLSQITGIHCTHNDKMQSVIIKKQKLCTNLRHEKAKDVLGNTIESLLQENPPYQASPTELQSTENKTETNLRPMCSNQLKSLDRT